ncbi:MAG: hydroxymethylbilane synthase [Mobilibacterium timonense]|uniref:hydroxymethylbilane synthase n=1 Tax=Mobilibacterium timonense TaxID=1871012 RepID=UPI00235564F8|nr:hydroxymethylbilane synthase [Mobilibacterium timonense]MBM6991174.1 hydroxymethylbilane synthase [Mobilibacterium timonense]
MADINDKKIKIGTRKSRLAVIQTEIVRDFLEERGMETEMVGMTTTGDRILNKTLDKIGGKGLFVRELDQALLDGRTDLSVHSLKDMPMMIPEELPVVAFSRREDPRDVLVLPEGVSELDKTRPIGSSSLRRKLQLKKLFPGHEFRSVRGNVLTRLEKLDRGEFGALVLAAAGLKRLGLEHRISRYFSTDEILPAAGQGVLVVQGRRGEDYSYLREFDDRDSRVCSLAERAFVRYLDGGCTSPVAAYGEVHGSFVHLTGLYYNDPTGQWHRDSIDGPSEDAERLGITLAKKMKGRYI